MKIKIDKNSKQPLYKQIVDQVTLLSKCGIYEAGEKLPTERDFALTYQIARGTVKRAYDKLVKNGTIVVVQGKGSFIKDNTKMDNQKPRTIHVIDKYLDRLTELGFSLDEIEMYVAQKLKERGEKQDTMRIAVIECCPESLANMVASVSVFSGTEIVGLLLDDVLANPELLFDDYSLIVAADVHMVLVESLVPSLIKKTVPISFCLCPQTIHEIASFRPEDRLGVFGGTKRFLDSVCHELEILDDTIKLKGVFLSPSTADFEVFLEKLTALLVAPCYKDYATPEQKEMIDRFLARGGRLVFFDYTFERGSFMYMEELLRKVRVENYDILQ